MSRVVIFIGFEYFHAYECRLEGREYLNQEKEEEEEEEEEDEEKKKEEEKEEEDLFSLCIMFVKWIRMRTQTI